MLTCTRIFSLTIAALLVLTLVPGARIGYTQGRPTTTALPSVNPAHPLFSTAIAA